MSLQNSKGGVQEFSFLFLVYFLHILQGFFMPWFPKNYVRFLSTVYTHKKLDYYYGKMCKIPFGESSKHKGLCYETFRLYFLSSEEQDQSPET
jgi:hypothetical protein